MSGYSEIAYVKVGNYGYDLQFQIIDDKTKQPVNLSGAISVKIIIGKLGEDTTKIIGDCTVVDASNGIVSYTVQNGDFDEENEEYDVEFDISFSGEVVTAWGAKIVVFKKLPRTVT